MSSERLTVPQKLLLAALNLREQAKITFSAEDLIVQAWRMFPDTFGLAGYSADYPDSNRVLTNIMGTKGMRQKGWLRKVGEKQYRLTPQAMQDGTELLARADDPQSQQRFLRAELDRQSIMLIERILNTAAARKALNELAGDFSFTDASGFWDISARSNANTLRTKLGDVQVVLERARVAASSDPEMHGIKTQTRFLTLENIETLIAAHAEMQSLFAADLKIISSRTDERLNKKRRT